MEIKVFRGLSALFFTGILIYLSGCTATDVLISGAQKALETRTTEDQLTDAKIHTGILDRVKDKDKSLLLDISVDVWEQRVMITGTLDDDNLRSEV